MKETYYAYGVARIRANELNLLSSADMEQLVTAPDYRAAVRLLSDKGWEADENSTDISALVKKRSDKNLLLINECLHDAHELDSLIVLNDFQNLKAALKCLFSDGDAEKYVVSPSIIPPQEIITAVKSNRYDKLPFYIKPAARGAYNILVQTENGQKADVFLDCAATEVMCKMAEESGSEMLIGVAEATADFANIKTAYRCILTGKDDEFAESAICSCGTIKKDALLAAVRGGFDDLCALVSMSKYQELSESLKKGAMYFEKRCDDLIIEMIESARSKAFGIDPVAAYYLAQDAEIKNIRIILNCKLSGVDSQIIMQRVRKLYV